MDNIFVVQYINDDLYRITTNASSKLYNTKEIYQFIPKLRYLVLITPFDINSKNLACNIFRNTEIYGCLNILPSTAVSFCTKVDDIFYVNIRKCDETKIYFTSVEIIQRGKFNRPYSKRFSSSNLDEIIYDIFSHLNQMDDKENLACNIFIDSDDKNLKSTVESKILMKLSTNGTSNSYVIKYAKFLKLPSYLIKSNICNGIINDDPVSFGGLIGGKAIFDTSEFMKRADYENNNYTKLNIYDIYE